MKPLLLALTLLTALSSAACGTRSLDTESVRKFVDAADDAARRRYAPHICAARGTNFKFHQSFELDQTGAERRDVSMGKALFCKQAASFSKLNQYVLERGPLTVTLSADHRTATVEADYVEKMPFYEDGGMPLQSPDIYDQVQVAETHDKSVVGIEDGKLVFLSTESKVKARLMPRHDMPLPYT